MVERCVLRSTLNSNAPFDIPTGCMDTLLAFALVAITTALSVIFCAHHARLERHHRGRASSSECVGFAAAYLALQRGGIESPDIATPETAKHPKFANRGALCVIPDWSINDSSVAAMATAASAVGTYLDHASRGWPHRLEVTARVAGAVALVAMVPAVALAWLPGSGPLWVVAVCGAVLTISEAVFAWRRHEDHVVGAAQLDLARVVRRGDELASIENLLRWRLAPACGAAAVFATIGAVAGAMALR